ncbi:MAG: DMT family transporter [Rhodobacteraceae bacterium]|nr:DMT family transporter [Paracoccaceae bacterium]
MELWILITIAAAFLQNLRSMLQKHLKARLSSLGATAIRFFFAMPLAWLLWAWLGEGPATALPMRFFMFTGLAAIGQIIGTLLLLYLFGLKNFAVGSTLARTEAVQTAIIGFVLLGDSVSLWAMVGILTSLVGVVLIAGNLNMARLEARTIGIGLASGTSFAIASVLYRAATQELDGGGAASHGAAVLLVATSFQSALLLAWFLLKDRPQLCAILINWRLGMLVGLTGALASLGWFTAFSLQNAAYVKAVAQVEILFTLLASWLFFKEVIRRIELIGIAFIATGILLLVLT